MRKTTITKRIQQRHTLRKSSELCIKDFYWVFVRTETDLIAFSGPQNCVNMQYAALSGAMVTHMCEYILIVLSCLRRNQNF